ncbi:MAG: hypothetical protein PSV35_09025, partial [bacterium]|nr:hypothetical protein [bacterium]
LLKWSQNCNSVTSFTNLPLIKLFQADLNIKSMADLDKKYINSCLDVFSQYCSLIFEYQNELAYAELNKKLGDTIQVEIHAVQHQRVNHSSSWQSVYLDVMNTLGMK